MINNTFNKLSSEYGYNSKSFNNYVVYENIFDMTVISRKLQAAKYYAVFWSGMSLLTYFYIHPYAIVIPIWFTLNTIGTTISGRRYMSKLVKRITLNEDMLNCTIELSDTTKLDVLVDNNELVDIKNILDDGKNQEINDKYNQSNYIVLFDTHTVAEPNKVHQLRVMISKDQCDISNPELFKDVVQGENLNEYKFTEYAIEEEGDIQQETDEEITKRLKDELKL